MQYVIYKLSGKVLADPASLQQALANIAKQSQALQHQAVIVHGGGPYADQWQQNAGLSVVKHNGLRVTPQADLPVITGALAGYAHIQLLGVLKQLGIQAVGMTPTTGATLRCELHPEHQVLGSVGQVCANSGHFIDSICSQGYWPVFHSIAYTASGQCVNVNADDVAVALANTLNAAAILFISDVPGIFDHQGVTLPQITCAQIAKLLAQETIHSGMHTKLASLQAINWAVTKRVVIGALEVLTEPDAGTEIIATSKTSEVAL